MWELSVSFLKCETSVIYIESGILRLRYAI